MARSKATFGKREKEKKKQERRQEKADKKEERKANAKKGASLEDMMMYMDENGHLTSEPPDPKLRRKEVDASEIELDIRKKQAADAEEARRTGIVTMFNHEKGYGFIRDLVSQRSVFVHINEVDGELKENDKVTFEIMRTPKGDSAVGVKKNA